MQLKFKPPSARCNTAWDLVWLYLDRVLTAEFEEEKGVACNARIVAIMTFIGCLDISSIFVL